MLVPKGRNKAIIFAAQANYEYVTTIFLLIFGTIIVNSSLNIGYSPSSFLINQNSNMKNLAFLLVVFLMVAQGASAQKKAKKNTDSNKTAYKVVCVGFYNLENLFDTLNTPDVRDSDFTPTGSYAYTGEVYQEKLQNLSYVVSQLGTEKTADGAALLGVCEIENKDVLDDFVKQPLIKDRNYQIVHYNSLDKRGIDVGLLYNPKYFSVIESGKITPKLFYDNENDGKEVEKRDTVFTRDMLWVKGKLDGEEVYAIVCHWPSRRGGSYLREGAAKFCKDFTDKILEKEPNAKIIIMGDLNDDPVSPSVKNVIGARAKKEQTKKGQFFNPAYTLYTQGLGTLAWNDSWNLFDQMLVSHALLNDNKGYRFYAYSRFNKPFLLNKAGRYKGYPYRTYVGGKYQGGYSDHLPVYMYLVKKK